MTRLFQFEVRMPKRDPDQPRRFLPHTKEILDYGRDRRLAAGLSQRQVAAEIGTGQSAVSEIESKTQIEFWFGTIRRIWMTIGIRVSLVFWKGRRIARVFEVGAQPALSEPSVTEGMAPMPDVRHDTTLVPASGWTRRRLDYASATQRVVQARPSRRDPDLAEILQLRQQRTLSRERVTKNLTEAGWAPPA